MDCHRGNNRYSQQRLGDWDRTVTVPSPLADQFGTVEFELMVDSHGPTDTKNMTLTVNNINDKPVVVTSVLTVRSSRDVSYTNIVPEGLVVSPSSLLTSFNKQVVHP